MVLPKEELQKAVDSELIKIDPKPVEKQFGPTSIDLHLGPIFTPIVSKGISVSLLKNASDVVGDLWKEGEITKNAYGNTQPFPLEPGKLVLAKTLEKIVAIPKSLVGVVEGRSCYARVGMSIHQTAPWLHPGWKGHIYLEIFNCGPWTVNLMPEQERICQISFMELTKEVVKAYGDRPEDQFQDRS